MERELISAAQKLIKQGDIDILKDGTRIGSRRLDQEILDKTMKFIKVQEWPLSFPNVDVLCPSISGR